MRVNLNTLHPEELFSLDEWRAPQRRKWTKVLAILISISFLMPFVSFAFEAGAYPAGLIGEFGYTPLKANGNMVKIKPEWGRVTSSFEGNAGRTIVYIQDLHCNYEVQTNIRLMLERMMLKNKLRLVGVEGESTPVSVEKLATVPAKDLKENISEYFMRRGRITGPEYQAALTEGELMLQGIEAENLYVDNRDTLMKFLNEESQGYCEDLRYSLERLKRPLYNMNLAKMDHKQEDFNNENISLESYSDFLLLEAHSVGVELDPFKVMRLYALEHKLPVNAAVDYERLLQEAEALDRMIRKKMYTSHEQRQLDHYLYILKVMENLVNISATEEDLRYYRTHKEEFKITTMLHFLEDISYRFAIQPDLDPGILKMNQYLNLAAKFYNVADKRSHAFVENIMKAMDKKKQNISVLITGGFHASHVETALRKRGVSFITVKPRITSTDAANPYFSLLKNEKTPLEKLLARNENIFAPRSLFNNALFKRYVETVWEVELGRKLVLEQGLSGEALQTAFKETRGNYAADDPNVALVFQSENSNPEKGVYVFTFANAPEHFVVIRPNTTQNYTVSVPGEALNGNNFMFQFVSQEEFAEKRADILGTEKKGRGGVFALTNLIGQIGEIGSPVTRAMGALAMTLSRPGLLQKAFMTLTNGLASFSPRAIREGWEGFRSMVAGNKVTAAWLTTVTGFMLVGSILMGMFPIASIAFAGAFVWSAGTLMQNNQFKALANSVMMPQGDLITRARVWASESYGYGANTMKQTDFQLALENVMTLAETDATLNEFIANRADRLAMAGMAYRNGMMPWTEGTPTSQVEALASDFIEAETLAEQVAKGAKAADLAPQGNSSLAQLIATIQLNQKNFRLGVQDFLSPERTLPEYMTLTQQEAMRTLAKTNEVELEVLDIVFNPITNFRPTLQQEEQVKGNVIQFRETLKANTVVDDIPLARAATGVQQEVEATDDALAVLDGELELGSINLTENQQPVDAGSVAAQGEEAQGLELSTRQKTLLDRWFSVDGWNAKHVKMDVFTAYNQALTRAQIAGLISNTGDNAEVHELGVTLLYKISESLAQATEGLYSAGDLLEVFRIVWERGYSVEVATKRFMNERQEYLSRETGAIIPETFARYEQTNGPIQTVADVQKMLRDGYAGEQLAIIPAYRYFADQVAAQEQAAMIGDANYTVELFLNFNEKIGQRLAGLPAAIQEPVTQGLYAEVTKAMTDGPGAMSILVAKKLSTVITNQQAAISALRNFDKFMNENMNDAIFKGQESAVRDGLRTYGQDLLRQVAAQNALGLFSNKAPPSQETLKQLLPAGYPSELLENLKDSKITAAFPQFSSQFIRLYAYLASQADHTTAVEELTTALETSRARQADIQSFIVNQLSEMNSFFGELPWTEVIQIITSQYIKQFGDSEAARSNTQVEQMKTLTMDLQVVIESLNEIQTKHDGETVAIAAIAPKTAYQAAPVARNRPAVHLRSWLKTVRSQQLGGVSLLNELKAPEVSDLTMKAYDLDDYDAKRGAFQSTMFRAADGTLSYRVATGERMTVTLKQGEKFLIGSTDFDNCAAGIIRGTNAKGETVISFGHLEAGNEQGQFQRLQQDMQDMRAAGVGNLEVFIQVYPGALEGTIDPDSPWSESYFTFPKTKAEVQEALGADVAIVDVQYKEVTKKGEAELANVYIDENGVTVEYSLNPSLAPVEYAWRDGDIKTAKQGVGLELKPELQLQAYDPWSGAVALETYVDQKVQQTITTELKRIGFTIGSDSRVSISKETLVSRIDRNRNRLLVEREKAEKRYQILNKKKNLSMDNVQEMKQLKDRINTGFVTANDALLQIRSSIVNGPALSYKVLVSDQMIDTEHGVALVRGDQICLNANQIQKYAAKNNVSKLMRLLAHETGHIAGADGTQTGEAFAGIFARLASGYDLGIEAINNEFDKAGDRRVSEVGSDTAFSGANATKDDLVASVKTTFNDALSQYRTGRYNQSKLMDLLAEAEKVMGILVERYSGDEDIQNLQAILAEQKVLLVQGMQLNVFTSRNPSFRQALERIMDQVEESEAPVAISDFMTYAVDGGQVVSRGGVPHATYSNPNAENIRAATYAGYMRVAVINGQTVLCVDNGSSHYGRPGFRGAEKKFITTLRGIKQALPALGIDKVAFFDGHSLEGMTAFDQSKIVGVMDLTTPTLRASKDINIQASRHARTKLAMSMDNAVLRSAVADDEALNVETVGEQLGRGLRVAAVQDQLPHPMNSNFTNWVNRTRDNIDSLQHNGAELVVFPERYLATDNPSKMADAMDELQKQANARNINIVMGVRLVAEGMPVDGVLFIRPDQPAVIARDLDTLRSVKEGTVSADPASRPQIQRVLAEFPIVKKAFADGLEMEDNLVGLTVGDTDYVLHLNICADARQASNYVNLPINVDLSVNVASTRPEDVDLYVDNIRKGLGETTPILVVNAGVRTDKQGGNTTFSKNSETKHRLQTEQQKNGVMAFEVAGLSATPVQIESYAQVQSRSEALQDEKSDVFARHIKMRSRDVVSVLEGFIEDQDVLQRVETALGGLTEEMFSVQTTDQISGAVAVNENTGDKINVIFERQLYGNLRASTVLHEVVETVLQANGIREFHALAFIVEHALFPESIEAKLSNPKHYDDAHLADIISNTDQVISEIDQQIGISDAIRIQQKNNAIDVLRAARKILSVRQRAAALNLGDRGFYGEETQKTLIQLMTEFLDARTGIAKALRLTARQQNIIVSQTAELANAIVKQGFSIMDQKQLNAFFSFFNHDVETRASEYTRELLRFEIQRMEKPLHGTMYQAAMARLHNILTQMEKNNPIKVAVLGEDQTIVDLKVRKVSPQEGMPSRATEIGAFLTLEKTDRGNIGYINVLEGHSVSEAVLHEVLESVLGEPHQTVNELSTFSKYSLGQMSSIRNFFREIMWPTRLLSGFFIGVGIVSLVVAATTTFFVSAITILSGVWIAVSLMFVVWGLYHYFKIKFVITVDGPDASGKHEIAQVLSRYYGYTLVDAGLYYRAYASVIRDAIESGKLEATIFENLAGIDAAIDQARKEINQKKTFRTGEGEKSIAYLLDYLDSLKAKKIQLVNYIETQVVGDLESASVSMQFDRAAAERRMRVFINPDGKGRQEITDDVIPRLDAEGQVQEVKEGLAIKTIVAALGKVPAVQDMMESQLRSLGRKQNIIAVGQTMGSKVFDRQARAKFYVVNNDLRSRVERKTKRRVSEEDFIAEMQRLTYSDKRARTRERDPLQAVTDAVVLNTTNFTLAEVVSMAHREVLGKSSVIQRLQNRFAGMFVSSNKMLTRAKGEALRKRILERGGDFWEAFSDIDGLSSYNLIYGKALTNCVLDDVLDVVTEAASFPSVQRYLRKGRLETLRKMRNALFQLRLMTVIRLIPQLTVGRIYTIRHGGDEGIYVLPDNLSVEDTEAVLELIRKAIQTRMHKQLMAFELKGADESHLESLNSIAREIENNYKRFGAKNIVRVVRDEVMGIRLMLKVGFTDLSKSQKKKLIAQLEKDLEGYLDADQHAAFLNGESLEDAGGRLMQGLVQQYMEKMSLDIQMKSMKMADLVTEDLRVAARDLGVDYLEKGAVLTTTTTTGATKPSRVPNGMVQKQRQGTITRTEVNQWDDAAYELAGDFLHAGKRGEKHAVYGNHLTLDVEKGMKKNQVVVDQMNKPIEVKEVEEGATLLGETHTEQMQLQKLLFEDNLLLKTEYRDNGNGHKQKYETLYPRHFTIEGLRETVTQRLSFLKGKKDFKTEVYIGRAPPSTGPDKIQLVVVSPKETHLIEIEGQYYGKFIQDARQTFAEGYAEDVAANMKAAGDHRSIEEIIEEIESDTENFETVIDEEMRDKFVSMFVDAEGNLVSAKEAATKTGAERSKLTPKYYKFKFLNDYISYSAGDQMIALPHLAIDTIGTDVLQTGKPIDQAVNAFVKVIEGEMNNPGYGNNAQVSLTAVYTSMPTAEIHKPGKVGRMFQDLQVASMAKEGKVTRYSKRLLATARKSMQELAVEKANSFYSELSAQVRMVRETTGLLSGKRRGEDGFARVGAAVSIMGLGIMALGIYGIVMSGVITPIAIGIVASGLLITVSTFITLNVFQNRTLTVQPQETTRLARVQKIARRVIDFVRGNPMIILVIGAGIFSFFNQEAGGGMFAMAAIGSLGTDNGYPGKMNLRIVEFTNPDGDTLKFKIPLDRAFKSNQPVDVIKNGNETELIEMGAQEIYAEFIWSIVQESFSQIPRPTKNHIRIFRNGPINGVKRYINTVVSQVFDGQEEMRGELQNAIADSWEKLFDDSFGMRRYLAKRTVEKEITIDGKLIRIIFTDIKRSEQLRIVEALQQPSVLDASLEEIFGIGLPERFLKEDYLSVSYIDKGAEKAAYLLNLKAGRGFRSLVFKTTNKPNDSEVITSAIEAYTKLVENGEYEVLGVGAFGKDWIIEEYFAGERITAWEAEFENPSEEFLEHFREAVIAVVAEYMQLAKIGATIFDPTFKNILVKRNRSGKKTEWEAGIVDMTTLTFPKDFPEERHLYRLHENFKKGWSDRREWVTYDLIYEGVLKAYGPAWGKAYLQKTLDNMIAISKERALYDREQLEFDTLTEFLNNFEKENLMGTIRGARGELLIGRLFKNAAENLYDVTFQPVKALAAIATFSRDRVEELVHAIFSAQGLRAVTLSRYRGRASPIRDQLATYIEMAVDSARTDADATQIKKIKARRMPIQIVRRVQEKEIETDQDLYETGAFHLNGRVYMTRAAFKQFENNRKDNKAVAAIVMHEALESVGFSHDEADSLVAEVTGYTTEMLIARVEGVGVVSGILTSDKSNPGRLKDTDDYTLETLLPALGIDLAQPNPVTGKAPVFVEVGPGRGAVTTLETANRLHQINSDIQVIGIENSLENYGSVQSFARENVSFELGGFDIQQQNVDMIRCTNVLSWYQNDQQKLEAIQTMGKALREGGILIEGRVSTEGKDSAILVHIKQGGRMVPHQMMMKFTNMQHEFPDGLGQPELTQKIVANLVQARSTAIQSLREDFKMLSDQILRLLPSRINYVMRSEYGYELDPKDSAKLLINFDQAGRPKLSQLNHQWLSLRNTLMTTMVWTLLILPFVGTGPALTIGILYPLTKLVVTVRLLIAKHGWSGVFEKWSEPVGAYDPGTQKMVDPITGQVLAEAAWPIVAHESYSHVMADRLTRWVGIDITKQKPGTVTSQITRGLLEFMAHTLDFFTAPIAISQIDAGRFVRISAMAISGLFVLSGLAVVAAFTVAAPLAISGVILGIFGVSAIALTLFQGRVRFTPEAAPNQVLLDVWETKGTLDERVERLTAYLNDKYDIELVQGEHGYADKYNEVLISQFVRTLAMLPESILSSDTLTGLRLAESTGAYLDDIIGSFKEGVATIAEPSYRLFDGEAYLGAILHEIGHSLEEAFTPNQMKVLESAYNTLKRNGDFMDGRFGRFSDMRSSVQKESLSQFIAEFTKQFVVDARALAVHRSALKNRSSRRAYAQINEVYQQHFGQRYTDKASARYLNQALVEMETTNQAYLEEVAALGSKVPFARLLTQKGGRLFSDYILEKTGVDLESIVAIANRLPESDSTYSLNVNLQGVVQPIALTRSELQEGIMLRYLEQGLEALSMQQWDTMAIAFGKSNQFVANDINAQQTIIMKLRELDETTTKQQALEVLRAHMQTLKTEAEKKAWEDIILKVSLSQQEYKERLSNLLDEGVNAFKEYKERLGIDPFEETKGKKPLISGGSSELFLIEVKTPEPFAQVDDAGTIQSVVEQIQRIHQIDAATPQTEVAPQNQLLRNIREGRLGLWFNRMIGIPMGLRLMLLSRPGLQGFAKTVMIGIAVSAWVGLGTVLMGGFGSEVAVAATMFGIATMTPAQYYHYRLRTSIASNAGQQVVSSQWMQQSLKNLEQGWSQAKVLVHIQGILSVLDRVQENEQSSQGVLEVLSEIPGVEKVTVDLTTKDGTTISQVVPRIILEKPYLTRKLFRVFPTILRNGEPLKQPKPLYRRGLDSAA